MTANHSLQVFFANSQIVLIDTDHFIVQILNSMFRSDKRSLTKNSFFFLNSRQYNGDADFSIKQISLRRSFIERQLNYRKSMKSRVFYCTNCPHISTSVLEYDHHRSCHRENSTTLYKCNYCSFASNSLLYTVSSDMFCLIYFKSY